MGLGTEAGTDIETTEFVETQRRRVNDVRFLDEEIDIKTVFDIWQGLLVDFSKNGRPN